MDTHEPIIAISNHMPLRIAGDLVSIAGLRGRFVFDRTGRHVGRFADLVVRLDTEAPHPPIHGALVRAGAKLHYIPEAAIAGIRYWNLFQPSASHPEASPPTITWSGSPTTSGYRTPPGSPTSSLPAASTASCW